MSDTISIRVRGSDAWSAVLDDLHDRLDEHDMSAVDDVWVEVEHNDGTVLEVDLHATATDDPEPDPEPAVSDGKREPYQPLREQDRELGEPSGESEVAVLKKLEAVETPIEYRALADSIDGFPDGTISSALTQLYKKRLVDREKVTGESGRKYRYTLSEHGRLAIGGDE